LTKTTGSPAFGCTLYNSQILVNPPASKTVTALPVGAFGLDCRSETRKTVIALQAEL